MDGAKIWQDFYFLTPGLPTSGQNNPTAGSKQPNRWVGPFLTQFQVDLQYVSDIILHFNPRYERGGYVVHNTFQNVGWGSEEWKYENPFPRDHPFALQILVTGSHITTNGKPFSEYKHRLPSSHVNSICVGGQVEVNLIAFQYLGVMFSAEFMGGINIWQDFYFLTPGLSTSVYIESYLITHNQTVPYKSIIHGGLKPGKAIIIPGIISQSADSISDEQLLLTNTITSSTY
uniref:Galectin n=1 Tax=Cyprinus carpio TaxID=7962 RepID=A0A8C1T536_CYPCA